ncbi:MAG: phage holin family protein [Spirosomataceae bacterium]
MRLLIRLVIITLGVLVAVNIVDGVDVPGTQEAVVVAVVFGLLNAFLKPVLQLLALPVTILTLGIFYFVINVFIVYLTAFIVPSFTVEGFFPALFFSIIVSIVSWLLGIFLD